MQKQGQFQKYSVVSTSQQQALSDQNSGAKTSLKKVVAHPMLNKSSTVEPTQ
jgi:hypothetical protein